MNQVNVYQQLQKCHDDQVIGPEELAALLNTTYKVVYKIHSDSPSKLPPRLVLFGRKLCWRLGTCREWIRSLEVAHVGASPKKATERGTQLNTAILASNEVDIQITRVGRPRKNSLTVGAHS
jgi:hypothetical protein